MFIHYSKMSLTSLTDVLVVTITTLSSGSRVVRPPGIITLLFLIIQANKWFSLIFKSFNGIEV